MAILKCKMCGGDLEIAAGVTVAECEYCGTKQTVPKANDEVIQNLFNRANNLRIKCEFDKAEQIYEKILHENDAEAEAHWGIVLCKYGIEYVEDPATFKRIPTCHRTSYDAVTTDADYLSAIEHADAVQKSIYEAEAKAIDAIQKDILSIVKNEKPFDVFICYKETDENGKRTQDSVIANDIYYQLTQEGLKVFYAAITLEDKLGQEYEPYIFAALNSAKVMLVLGTKPQYFSAVWVKNEWSRFLKLMKADRSKLLIPCYRDMDAYDLPEEFSHLQAQDMSKIGFINDIVRGIKKVIVKDEPKATVIKETVVTSGNANTAPLLERAFMFLEDGDWDRADEFCEQVLNIDPKNVAAYLGKLMSELKVRTQEQLKDQEEPFGHCNNYQKALRFADDALKATLSGYIEHINTRNENTRLENQYVCAQKALRGAMTEHAYKLAAVQFEKLGSYKDATALVQTCYERAEDTRKDTILAEGKSKMIGEATYNYEAAIKLFESIPGWRDADEQIIACQRKIEEIKAKEEAERLEKERQAEIARKEAERIAKRNKKIAIITTPIVCAVIAFIILLNTVIIPNGKYNDAIALMEAGKYDEAIAVFHTLGEYKDSAIKILDIKYDIAIDLMNKEKYTEAISAFTELGDYKESKTKIAECETSILDGKYDSAVALMNERNYQYAITGFQALGEYKDSSQKVIECLEAIYNNALKLFMEGQYIEAIDVMQTIHASHPSGYRDSVTKILESKYQYIQKNKNNTDRRTYQYLKDLTATGYRDSASIYKALYAWKITFIVNWSEHDKKTSLTSIPYSPDTPLYVHFLVSGGEPGETLCFHGKVNNEFFFKKINNKYDELHAGESYVYEIDWRWWFTRKPSKATSIIINLYDEDGNGIGSYSINIVP